MNRFADIAERTMCLMGHQGNRGERPAGRLVPADAKAVATTFQALSAPSRLLILDRLRERPLSVGELATVVGMEQSAVSQQLRVLRNLGLVVGDRLGRSIVYRLYDDHVADLIDQAFYHAEHLRLGLADKSLRT